ncbi:MAG: hypothetical protein GWO02_07355 [Gammaproteobacteria bacterium]|nr:hypothetical protein [Gammaproteobacteria bacterium]
MFGSYDDLPAASNCSSLYMNLRHHLMHQRNAGSTHNFWSGFGAVRRGAFLDLGGFESKSFPEPSVEDIEFGHRLADDGGRALLDPGLLCTHLKHWSLRNLVHTDCVHRALPWSQLLIRNGGRGMTLNVSRAERGRAIVALSALFATLFSLVGVLSWWSSVPLIVATLLLNRSLVKLIYQRGGAVPAFFGALYHQIYYVYSTAIYMGCWLSALGRRLFRRRALPA